MCVCLRLKHIAHGLITFGYFSHIDVHSHPTGQVNLAAMVGMETANNRCKLLIRFKIFKIFLRLFLLYVNGTLHIKLHFDYCE